MLSLNSNNNQKFFEIIPGIAIVDFEILQQMHLTLMTLCFQFLDGKQENIWIALKYPLHTIHDATKEV